MYPVSPQFLAALASPQQVVLQADVSKAGVRLASGLPIVGGSITVDSGAITRRALSCTIAPRLATGTYTETPALPRSPGDPLAHYGQEVTVQWGVTYPDGATEWVPLGVFRIDSTRGSLLADEPVTVTGVSREAHVADARFTSPRTVSSQSAQELIATLIREVLPSVEVVFRATTDRRVPRTTWDEDRWGAITDLATSITAVVYADPWGRFVIADAPTLATAPVWTARSGPGGVLVSADVTSSRRSTYNGVVVRGESASTDVPPVSGSAYDTTPSSPTRWGDPMAGAFGMVPRFVSVPTITTAAQAESVARAQLARFTGAASSIDVTTVPNVALEALDVLDVITDPADPAGSTRRHLIDSLTISLVAGGAFPLRTRYLKDAADG